MKFAEPFSFSLVVALVFMLVIGPLAAIPSSIVAFLLVAIFPAR